MVMIALCTKRSAGEHSCQVPGRTIMLQFSTWGRGGGGGGLEGFTRSTGTDNIFSQILQEHAHRAVCVQPGP